MSLLQAAHSIVTKKMTNFLVKKENKNEDNVPKKYQTLIKDNPKKKQLVVFFSKTGTDPSLLLGMHQDGY